MIILLSMIMNIKAFNHCCIIIILALTAKGCSISIKMLYLQKEYLTIWLKNINKNPFASFLQK
ncbi:MAG: hypothetical protein B6D64_01825 [Bacteroidetes bacterium 4484_276]|nr:MAG: hypothetical protein B6D64_01825 [Bacteroidetes bacterium 4484_276]OYT13883.1 MAG: hypothetical protein B6I19_02795 [Bacteroidetes bacterium 4572_114]